MPNKSTPQTPEKSQDPTKPVPTRNMRTRLLSRTDPTTSSSRPQTASPTGTVMAAPCRSDLRLAGEANGCLQRDAEDCVLVDMTVDLEH